MADNDTVVVGKDELAAMTATRLMDGGLSKADADIVADILVFAELRGVASHGVLRVEHYVNRMRQGGINLKADLAVEFVKPTIGRLDAKGAMGHVATRLATAEAIRAAGEQGMALVGVSNNSHNGALGYYAQMALDAGMAALVLSNVNSLVAPFGGVKPFLGPNPLAFAFPGRNGDILLDMATSEVAFGKILDYRVKKKPLPQGWGLDADGKPTTDPDRVVALTPFGGAKGYGIAIMAEALTGLMVGGVFGPYVAEMYKDLDKYRNVSSTVWVIDPKVVGGEAVLDVTQRMIDEIHAQPAANGFSRVLAPGDLERACAEERAKTGIPVPKSLYDYLSSGTN